jgi:hypothetical protein
MYAIIDFRNHLKTNFTQKHQSEIARSGARSVAVGIFLDQSSDTV